MCGGVVGCWLEVGKGLTTAHVCIGKTRKREHLLGRHRKRKKDFSLVLFCIVLSVPGSARTHGGSAFRNSWLNFHPHNFAGVLAFRVARAGGGSLLCAASAVTLRRQSSRTSSKCRVGRTSFSNSTIRRRSRLYCL